MLPIIVNLLQRVVRTCLPLKVLFECCFQYLACYMHDAPSIGNVNPLWRRQLRRYALMSGFPSQLLFETLFGNSQGFDPTSMALLHDALSASVSQVRNLYPAEDVSDL